MENVVVFSVRVRSRLSHNVLLTLAFWGFLFFWHRVPSSSVTATDCNGWVIAFWTAVFYKAPLQRKTASSNTEIRIRAQIRGRSTFGEYQTEKKKGVVKEITEKNTKH